MNYATHNHIYHSLHFLHIIPHLEMKNTNNIGNRLRDAGPKFATLKILIYFLKNTHFLSSF